MLRSDASVAAFAACVGFACYLNSVICGFVFDDRLAIIDNADVQHGAPLADVWVNDFWGKSLRKTDSHKSYRPLTVLSFRAHTWWRQGPPEPAPFHAVNAAPAALAKKASFVGTKGGVGKSTSCKQISAAVAAHRPTKQTVVVDLDPQCHQAFRVAGTGFYPHTERGGAPKGPGAGGCTQRRHAPGT